MLRFFFPSAKIKEAVLKRLHLAVVLEDVGGCDQVQHAVDHQLTVTSELIALLLQERYLRLLLALT